LYFQVIINKKIEKTRLNIALLVWFLATTM
jgi:hypothetical protein